MRYVLLSLLTLFACSVHASTGLGGDSIKVVLETSPGAEIGVDGIMSSTNRISLVVAGGEHEGGRFRC